MANYAKKVCAVAIFAAFVATAFLTTNAYAEEVEVSDFASLKTAIADGNDAKLMANFSMTSGIKFEKPMTLDLNGHKLNAAWKMIDVESTVTIDDTSSDKNGEINNVSVLIISYTTTDGDLTINAGKIENDYSTIQFLKKGKLTMNGGTVMSYDCAHGGTIYVNGGSSFTMNGGSAVVECSSSDNKAVAPINVSDDGSEFIFNDGEVTSDMIGVAVFANSKFIMNGGAIATNSYGIATNGINDPSNKDYGANAEIIVNDGTITSANGAAIYAPAVDGKTTINGGTLTGKTGIEIRSGNLEVKGGTITATADEYKVTANSNGATTEGAAVAIVQHNSKQAISVTICGGKLSGFVPVNEANAQGNEIEDISKISLTINEACADSDPEFTSTDTSDDAAIFNIENEDIINKFAKGGRYSLRVPEKFIADGYTEPDETENGMYVIKPIANPATADDIIAQLMLLGASFGGLAVVANLKRR